MKSMHNAFYFSSPAGKASTLANFWQQLGGELVSVYTETDILDILDEVRFVMKEQLREDT